MSTRTKGEGLEKELRRLTCKGRVEISASGWHHINKYRHQHPTEAPIILLCFPTSNIWNPTLRLLIQVCDRRTTLEAIASSTLVTDIHLSDFPGRKLRRTSSLTAVLSPIALVRAVLLYVSSPAFRHLWHSAEGGCFAPHQKRGSKHPSFGRYSDCGMWGRDQRKTFSVRRVMKTFS